MGKSPAKELQQVQTYLSPKELKELDKVARDSLRSRSDTVRLMIANSLKNYR
jgi:metal-responsive CopG/Arc/MetJ family transcriptional regulator